MPKINESSYSQGPILVDGLYPIKLKKVEEYTKTYDGKETNRWAWVFDVQADESALDDSVEVEIEGWEPSGHYEVAAHTGTTRSTKANSNWAKLGMDVIVPANVEDTEDLIGVEGTGFVSSFEAADGLTKNTIEKIRPAKKGKKKETVPASKKDDVEINEQDFDVIPFAHFNMKQRIVEGIL